MEQEKSYEKRRSILKRIRYYMTSQEKLEAHLLDYMLAHPELTPEPSAPPAGEFDKIMDRLKKEGSVTVIRKQLQKLYARYRFVNLLHKPLLLVMIVLVILGNVFVGTSAGKTYGNIWTTTVLCLLPSVKTPE